VSEPQKQRTCIFCGSTPLTKEYVFGQWTEEFFPRPLREGKRNNADLRRHLVANRTENVLGEPEIRFEEHGLDIPIREVTVKVVCARCNNGWMGDLELRMKRLFTRMREAKVSLEMADIDLLTRWSIKTGVIWQYNHQKSVVVTEQQRNALRAGEPVPGASLRIGRRKFGERDSLYMFGTTLETAIDDDWELGREQTISITMFAAGPLVVVLTLGHYADEARMAGITALPRQKIRRPKAGLVWPGAFRKMTLAEFDSLVFALGHANRGKRAPEEEQMLEYLEFQRSVLRG
jgi:hypothetical protein